jgi:uncharacterized protein (TIGR02246 family)
MEMIEVGTMDELLVRRAGEDVVHALCDALDAKDSGAVGELFAPDGAFAAFGEPMIGPSAIASAMSHLSSAPDQRHVVTNVRSSVQPGSPDAVVVDAVFSVFHFGGPSNAPTMMLQTRTECVRRDGRMLIAHHSGRPLTAMPPPPGQASR